MGGWCKNAKKPYDLETTNQTNTNLHMSIKSDFNSLYEQNFGKTIQIYLLKNILVMNNQKEKKFEINSKEIINSKNGIIYLAVVDVNIIFLI